MHLQGVPSPDCPYVSNVAELVRAQAPDLYAFRVCYGETCIVLIEVHIVQDIA